MKTRMGVGAIWAVCCGLLLGVPVHGESLEPELVRLLSDQQVEPSTFTDGIWTLTPSKGRRLILLPFEVPASVTQAIRIETTPTKLAGGQFVAWYIPPREALPGQSLAAAAQGPGGLSAEPPRLTREAELRPGGTVHWKLTRGLPGGTVTDPKKAYALVLEPRLIDGPIQPRPALGNRVNPRPRPTAASAAEQRQKVALRQALRSLPDEFEAPAPARVFAVYYIPEKLPRLGLVGEDPLPWGIPYALFEQLRKDVNSGSPKDWRPVIEQLVRDEHPYSMRMAAAFLVAHDNLTKLDENSALLPLIEKIIVKGGPESRRMLLEPIITSAQPAPVGGAVLDFVMNDTDPGVALMGMRARASDSGKRDKPLDDRRLKALSDSANRLLESPGQFPIDAILDPVCSVARQNDAHLTALIGRVEVHKVPSDRREEMIAAVLLRARQGDALAARLLDRELLNPADANLASMTLQQVMLSPLRLGPTAPTGGGIASAPAVTVAPVVPERRNRGTARTARAVAFDLLETIGARAAERSLPPEGAPGVAAAAPREGGGGGFAALVGGVFGGPAGGTGTGAGAGAGASLPEGAGGPPDHPYPIDSPEHNLLKLLSGGPGPLRDMAWLTLPRFAIPAPDPKATSVAAARIGETYAALADAAIKLDPTPPQIVSFLQSQGDHKAAGSAMQRLLLRAHGPVRVTAMLDVAAGGHQALAQLLGEMIPDDRVELARLWYAMAASEQNKDPAPLTIGLLRPSDKATAGPKVTAWFAQQIAEGKRPIAADWAKAVGSDEALIGGLTENDEAYALGCAAAIIGTAVAPDEAAARQLRQSVQEIVAKDSDKEQTRREITLKWTEMRQQLVRERLAGAAGKYRLELRILPTAQTPRDKPEKLEPVTHDLGEIQMLVDKDGKVAFKPVLPASTSDRPLTVKLEKPQDLAALPAAASLNLNERGDLPTSAVDLTPDRKGRWTGNTMLPDQRSIRVVLTPLR